MEEKGLSNFMKLAYKKDKVREISQAFKEYPVLEEWHQGRKETFLEEEEIYSAYHVGDIIFVKEYYYQDGREGKNHLFVIIDQNNVSVPMENFGMLISSNLKKLKYQTNTLLQKNAQNGLKVDSLVKTDILYKIKNNQILFKIGEVENKKIEEYKQKFCELNEK